MRNRQTDERHCSYVVVLDKETPASELRDLANYLSTLRVADCDAVVVDGSPAHVFEQHARVLRWVARHVVPRPECAGGAGVVTAAIGLAGSDRVIIADQAVRYTPEAISRMCDLLDIHEVVEPQDYVDPLPWWGGVDAARILVHRAIEPQPDHGATFGFRKSAIRTLRGVGMTEPGDDHVRRLAAVGAEVFPAPQVFVRRRPAEFSDWLRRRAQTASDDFDMPAKAAFFMSVLPVLGFLAIVGGVHVAAGYGSVIAFAAVALAVRGRSGAASFFPLRACLFAPVWILERSLSVYWALFEKLRGVGSDAGATIVDPARGDRAASGE